MKKSRLNFVDVLSVLAFFEGILTLILAIIFFVGAFNPNVFGLDWPRYWSFIFGLVLLAISFLYFHLSEWKKFLRRKKLRNEREKIKEQVWGRTVNTNSPIKWEISDKQ